jgi:tripartite ATP-independent transporter DctP family solute receptor
MMNRRNLLVLLGCGPLALSLLPRRAEAATVLRIASVTGPQHHHNVALRWFAERVNKADPALDVRVLDGSQLGGERDYIEGMMLGSIEMAQVSTGPIGAFIPEFDLFSLPYLFRDTDHFVKVVNGQVGQTFFGLLEKRGIKGLCWFDNGYRDVFNTKRPIKEPADLHGLKIRSMESPVMVDTLNSMGAAATPMAYSGVYTALQQGVLDGAENAPGNVAADKFYEVCKYYSLTHHFRPPGVFGVSLKVWDRLAEGQKQLIAAQAKDLQVYEFDLTQKAEQKALADLKERGMQINDADLAAFRKAVEPVYVKFKAKYGPQLIDAVDAVK